MNTDPGDGMPRKTGGEEERGIRAIEETNVLLEVSFESGDQRPEVCWCHSRKNNVPSTYCVPATGHRDE